MTKTNKLLIHLKNRFHHDDDLLTSNWTRTTNEGRNPRGTSHRHPHSVQFSLVKFS